MPFDSHFHYRRVVQSVKEAHERHVVKNWCRKSMFSTSEAHPIMLVHHRKLKIRNRSAKVCLGVPFGVRTTKKSKDNLEIAIFRNFHGAATAEYILECRPWGRAPPAGGGDAPPQFWCWFSKQRISNIWSHHHVLCEKVFGVPVEISSIGPLLQKLCWFEFSAICIHKIAIN